MACQLREHERIALPRRQDAHHLVAAEARCHFQEQRLGHHVVDSKQFDDRWLGPTTRDGRAKAAPRHQEHRLAHGEPMQFGEHRLR